MGDLTTEYVDEQALGPLGPIGQDGMVGTALDAQGVRWADRRYRRVTPGVESGRVDTELIDQPRVIGQGKDYRGGRDMARRTVTFDDAVALIHAPNVPLPQRCPQVFNPV